MTTVNIFLISFNTYFVADTSSQDFREVSTTGVFLPATSDNYDQSQDAENIRQREEVEDAVEVGNDTSETVSIEKHEETGIRDKVTAESRRVEPEQPELNVYYAEDQDNEVNVSVPHNDKYNGEKETDEGKIMRRDEKDIRRHAEADDQAEKRENLETQIRERVEPELDVCDRHPIHDPLHKQNEMINEQRRVLDVMAEKDRQTDSGEQSDKALTVYLNEELQVSEGLDNVRQIHKDQGDKLKTGHDIDLKHVVIMDQRVHTEARPGDEELISESVKTRNDLHKYTDDVCDRNHEEQGEMRNIKGGKRGDDEHAQRRETSTIKNESDEGTEEQHRKLHGSRLEYVGTENRGQEEMIKYKINKCKKHLDDRTFVDNKESQKVISDISQNFNSRQSVPAEVKVDGKRNDDEDVKRRRRSEGYSGGGVEGQKNRSQEQRQLEIRYKDLGNQVKQDEKKGENVHSENREDVFAGREGSEGGRKHIEKNREGREQPDTQSVSVTGEMTGSKGQSIQHSKRTSSDTQSSIKVKKTRTETVEKTSHGSKNRSDQKEILKVKFDPETDTLTKNVHSLDLKEAPVSETKKKQTKGDRNMAEEDEIIVFHLNDKTMPNVSHAAAGIKHPGKKRGEKKSKWWHFQSLLKRDRKRQKKQKKTTGCFCIFSEKN